MVFSISVTHRTTFSRFASIISGVIIRRFICAICALVGGQIKLRAASVGVGQILRHINVIYSFGGEVRRGRFGVLGDLLYLNAQAGADATGLVSKLDLGLQQSSANSLLHTDSSKDPVAGWICSDGLDIPISASRWVYRPTTWQSIQPAPNWWTNSLSNSLHLTPTCELSSSKTS